MKPRTMTTDSILKFYMEEGIIGFDDILSSDKETIMKTIISKVHKYRITPPSKESKDQRWFTYVDDETKANGRRRVAKKSEQEIIDYLITFYGIERKASMSFAELYAEWVTYKEGFVKVNNKKKAISPSTINRYKRDFRNSLVETELAATPIADVTSVLLEETLRDVVVANALTESYTKNLYGYINNALEYAVRKRYIPANELSFVDKDKVLSFVTLTPPKSDSERVLTKSEVNALLASVYAHKQKYPTYLPDYAIILATLTGMRVGELAALHWTDIRDGAIHIDYSEHRYDYEDHYDLEIDEPKSLKHRMFPLNDAIIALLEEIKALGFNSEYVFGNNERRTTGHMISCACDRRAAEAGIKKTSIHGIRKTVASELRKKFDIKLVASLLGHLEEVDEVHYNFDNSEFVEKKAATEHLCSNVLKFPGTKKSKKEAKAQ